MQSFDDVVVLSICSKFNTVDDTLPVAVEPVKLILATDGCSDMTLPSAGALARELVTTFKIPGGKPASVASCNKLELVEVCVSFLQTLFAVAASSSTGYTAQSQNKPHRVPAKSRACLQPASAPPYSRRPGQMQLFG